MEGKLTEGEATREGKLREGEAAGSGREGARCIQSGVGGRLLMPKPEPLAIRVNFRLTG